MATLALQNIKVSVWSLADPMDSPELVLSLKQWGRYLIFMAEGKSKYWEILSAVSKFNSCSRRLVQSRVWRSQSLQTVPRIPHLPSCLLLLFSGPCSTNVMPTYPKIRDSKVKCYENTVWRFCMLHLIKQFVRNFQTFLIMDIYIW